MKSSSSPIKRRSLSQEHCRTDYLQGASEAWLKTGKSDLFVRFDSLRPINNLSVIKGRVFLG